MSELPRTLTDAINPSLFYFFLNFTSFERVHQRDDLASWRIECPVDPASYTVTDKPSADDRLFELNTGIDGDSIGLALHIGFIAECFERPRWAKSRMHALSDVLYANKSGTTCLLNSFLELQLLLVAR